MASASRSTSAEPFGPARARLPDSIRNRVTAAATGLCGVLLIATGLGVGAFVTQRGAAATGELALEVWFGQHRIPDLDFASELLAIAAGPVLGPLLVLCIAAFAWTWQRPAAVALAIVAILGWLSTGVGSFVFTRPRPPYVAVSALSYEGCNDSFPSGHTAFAWALLFGVVTALKFAGRRSRWAWLIGTPIALIVTVSRLYAGAHYVGDVIGAFFLAAGSTAILVGIWRGLPSAARASVITTLNGPDGPPKRPVNPFAK